MVVNEDVAVEDEDVDADVVVVLEEDDVLDDIEEELLVLLLVVVVNSSVGTLFRNAGSGLPAMMYR